MIIDAEKTQELLCYWSREYDVARCRIFPHFFLFFFDEGVKIENVIVFFCFFFCLSVELVLVFRIILGPKFGVNLKPYTGF